MDDLFRIIDSVNGWLWTDVVIVLLVFCAIYFTIRIRGVQFRLLKDMWRIIMDKPICDGKDPVFRREMMPEDEADIECWD